MSPLSPIAAKFLDFDSICQSNLQNPQNLNRNANSEQANQPLDPFESTNPLDRLRLKDLVKVINQLEPSSSTILKICANAACQELFEKSNKIRGKQCDQNQKPLSLCYRCYQYKKRHQGALPKTYRKYTPSQWDVRGNQEKRLKLIESLPKNITPETLLIHQIELTRKNLKKTIQAHPKYTLADKSNLILQFMQRKINKQKNNPQKALQQPIPPIQPVQVSPAPVAKAPVPKQIKSKSIKRKYQNTSLRSSSKCTPWNTYDFYLPETPKKLTPEKFCTEQLSPSLPQLNLTDYSFSPIQDEQPHKSRKGNISPKNLFDSLDLKIFND